MRVTRSQLRRIIKEEFRRVLREQSVHYPDKTLVGQVDVSDDELAFLDLLEKVAKQHQAAAGEDAADWAYDLYDAVQMGEGNQSKDGKVVGVSLADAKESLAMAVDSLAREPENSEWLTAMAMELPV